MSEQKYCTFKRSARNFEEFAHARKYYVDRDLTYTEAQRRCAEFNANRTPAQIAAGTKLEFTAQSAK